MTEKVKGNSFCLVWFHANAGLEGGFANLWTQTSEDSNWGVVVGMSNINIFTPVVWSLDVGAPLSEIEKTKCSFLCLWSRFSSYHHELMPAGQRSDVSLTITFRVANDIFMHIWGFSHVSVQEFLISRTLRWGSLWPVTSRWRECINNWIVFSHSNPRVCVCVCVTNRNREGGCLRWESWLRHRGGPLGIWRFILRFPNAKH